MNLLLLFIVVFLALFISIFVSNGDIFSPIVIGTASYFVGIAIAFVHNGLNGVDISDFLLMYITLSVVVMIGGFCVSQVCLPKGNIPVLKLNKIILEKWHLIVISIIELLCLCHIIGNYSYYSGIPFSFGNIVQIMYHGHWQEGSQNYSECIVWGCLILLCSTVRYLITYCLIYNQKIEKYINKSEKKWMYICLVFSFAVQIIQLGRIWIIHYFIFFFYILHISNNKEYDTRSLKSAFRDAFKILIGVVIFWGIFQLLGMLKFQTGVYSPFDTLYAYSGSSFLAFDQYRILGYRPAFHDTLYNLFSIFSHFGLNVLPNNAVSESINFVDVGYGLTTNIMPACGRYYFDFGYAIALLVQLLLGFVVGIFYSISSAYNRNPIFVFFYESLIGSLSLQFMSEQLLTYMLSLSFLIPLIWYIWLYKTGPIRVCWGRN